MVPELKDLICKVERGHISRWFKYSVNVCTGCYENIRRGEMQSQIEDVRYSFPDMTVKPILEATSRGPFGSCAPFLQFNLLEYGEYRREFFLLVGFLAQVQIRKEQIAKQ